MWSLCTFRSRVPRHKPNIDDKIVSAIKNKLYQLVELIHEE